VELVVEVQELVAVVLAVIKPLLYLLIQIQFIQ
jgi:hypothetical protein